MTGRALEPVEQPTLDEWVQRALDARVEQGFGVAIEDDATIAFLVDVLTNVDAPSDT